MSEYQRYEFMIVDRPLTRTELDAVNALYHRLRMILSRGLSCCHKIVAPIIWYG